MELDVEINLARAPTDTFRSGQRGRLHVSFPRLSPSRVPPQNASGVLDFILHLQEGIFRSRTSIQ